MIKLKHNTAFVLHRRDAADPLAHLVCRVRWTGSRTTVSLNLGFIMEPESWNAVGQCCPLRSVVGPQRIPARVVNNEVARYRKAADDVFARFAQTDTWPTADEVRAALRVELGIDAPKDVRTADAFEIFLREEGARCSWSVDTVKKLRSFQKNIAGFAPFATFGGFTSSNMSGFLKYLREEKGHNDNTCQRDFGYLRWFCAFAERRRWLTSPDWKEYAPKFRKTEDPVIFLTWDELMRVYKYEKEGTEHNTARDIFLFCCFTSLRFSDAMSLTWENMKEDVIDFVSIKTGKHLKVDFNTWSSEIIGRYVDVSVPGGFGFPRMSNQVCNRYLKAIAKECGIDEAVKCVEFRGSERCEEVVAKWSLISTHAGRRTFICNALMLGIPPTVVMQWTGHSDYRAMKPYIAIADTEKRERMGAFDRKL